MIKKVPNPIDKHVGSRVRMRRMLAGVSQEKLGEALGLTFQQVQKYENGTNRIDAARLAALSQALNVPPQWFFHDLGDAAGPGGAAPVVLDVLADGDDLARRETLTLIRAFNRIKDQEKRNRLVELVQAVGEAEGEEEAGPGSQLPG